MKCLIDHPHFFGYHYDDKGYCYFNIEPENINSYLNPSHEDIKVRAQEIYNQNGGDSVKNWKKAFFEINSSYENYKCCRHTSEMCFSCKLKAKNSLSYISNYFSLKSDLKFVCVSCFNPILDDLLICINCNKIVHPNCLGIKNYLEKCDCQIINYIKNNKNIRNIPRNIEYRPFYFFSMSMMNSVNQTLTINQTSDPLVNNEKSSVNQTCDSLVNNEKSSVNQTFDPPNYENLPFEFPPIYPNEKQNENNFDSQTENENKLPEIQTEKSIKKKYKFLSFLKLKISCGYKKS